MQTQQTRKGSLFASALRWSMAAAFTASTFSIPAVAAGAADIYKGKCAACHGADGSGATAMGKKFNLRDLRSAEVQKMSDEELQNAIANGKPPMPTFSKTLDAAQIHELVAYIRSMKK